jgi:hypothetical protein
MKLKKQKFKTANRSACIFLLCCLLLLPVSLAAADESAGQKKPGSEEAGN